MRLWLVLSVIALAGCGENADPPLHRASAQERRRALEEALARAPQSRSWHYADGELRVFEVPIRNGRMVDRQTCIVWRDTEMRTASLQCPSESVDVGPAPGETEGPRP
jgi:hypothetical protein